MCGFYSITLQRIINEQYTAFINCGTPHTGTFNFVPVFFSLLAIFVWFPDFLSYLVLWFGIAFTLLRYWLKLGCKPYKRLRGIHQ